MKRFNGSLNVGAPVCYLTITKLFQSKVSRGKAKVTLDFGLFPLSEKLRNRETTKRQNNYNTTQGDGMIKKI